MKNDLKFLAKSNGKKGYANNLKGFNSPFLKFSDNRKLRKKVLKVGNQEVLNLVIQDNKKLSY